MLSHLPDPFSPTRPTTSPESSSRLAPRRTAWLLLAGQMPRMYAFSTPDAVITGWLLGPSGRPPDVEVGESVGVGWDGWS